MPAVDFYIKEGDSSPPLIVTCLDEDENIIDLTAGIAFKFFMIDPGAATPKVDGRAAVVEGAPTNGQLRYNWQADGSDTDDPGDYDAEFEVEWSDGTRTTFPNFRFLRIKIAKTHETTD